MALPSWLQLTTTEGFGAAKLKRISDTRGETRKESCHRGVHVQVSRTAAAGEASTCTKLAHLSLSVCVVTEKWTWVSCRVSRRQGKWCVLLVDESGWLRESGLFLVA